MFRKIICPNDIAQNSVCKRNTKGFQSTFEISFQISKKLLLKFLLDLIVIRLSQLELRRTESYNKRRPGLTLLES